MTVQAHIDFETRSAVNLKKAGLYRYFEDPSTGVWVLRWRLNDGPVHEWRPGWAEPLSLLEAIQDGAEVAAHNNAFDRVCWNTQAPAHWPQLTPEQCDCTMARAAALAMPQGLDDVAKLLGLDVRKDKDGYRLMMKLARPKSVEPLAWNDAPADVDRLSAYCAQDVEVETAVDRRLPKLTPRERRVWELDQRINERGVAFDVAFARRAAALCAEAVDRANLEMRRLTGGEVAKVTEAAKIVRWLRNDRLIPCDSIAKGEVEELVVRARTAGDPEAEAVIRLRRAAAKSSTAKYGAINESVCADGRCRGLVNYHTAHTGRWGGRIVQPQNFPRLSDENRELVPAVLREVARVGERGVPKTLDAIEFITEQSALEVMSWMLRPTIVAGAGAKLNGGDYSNIEGRVNAWLAGESWKVQSFREFDAGVGDDLYRLAFSRSFGVAVDAVSKADRQIGKVLELSMGYQGGVGAFQNMAANYGVAVSDDRADELKRAWRDAHPDIVQSWWDLEDAVVAAVSSPGLVVPAYAGRIQFVMHQGALLCRLPSGRALHYHAAAVEWRPAEDAVMDGDRVVKPGRRAKRAVAFWGVDSLTKKWAKSYLYGGLICENIVQAVARDIMVEGMFLAEEEGFPLVLTVHDELLTEPGATSLRHDANTLQEIMTTLPAWARGLPLAAGTWEEDRYVK